MEANRAGDGGTAGDRGPNAASYPKVVGDVYTAAFVTRHSPPAPSHLSDVRGHARRRLLLRAVAAAAAAAFLCTMPASAARHGLAGPTRPGKLKTQCTKTTSVSLAGAIHNASAGATICLRSGSYGAVTLRSLSKSSDVTVRPAAGANVTIGSVNLQRMRHLRFTGLGGTMSVNGVEIDPSDTRPNCSSHLTFDHLRFTAAMDILPRCANMAILVDHANLNNVPSSRGGGTDQRAGDRSGAKRRSGHHDLE